MKEFWVYENEWGDIRAAKFDTVCLTKSVTHLHAFHDSFNMWQYQAKMYDHSFLFQRNTENNNNTIKKLNVFWFPAPYKCNPNQMCWSCSLCMAPEVENWSHLRILSHAFTSRQHITYIHLHSLLFWFPTFTILLIHYHHSFWIQNTHKVGVHRSQIFWSINDH